MHEIMILPKDFTQYMSDLLGEDEYAAFIENLHLQAPTSIRLNLKKKASVPKLGEQVCWCRDGYYLEERPKFTTDPFLHAGAYYVQESSSMFLDFVMKCLVSDNNINTVLDLCAAPGGKSTILRANIPNESLLVSNEPIIKRAHILAENLMKQGYSNNIVVNNYPKDFAKCGLQFDLILCDVPCSGEGMFRKDSFAIEDWSAHKVASCQQLQREIVTEAWKCLNDNGVLIYSTCTYNTHENEENIQWILNELDGQLIEIPIEEKWKITGSLLSEFDKPVYRFLPHKTRGEGLFMAVIRKANSNEFKPAPTLSNSDNKERQTLLWKDYNISIAKRWIKAFQTAEKRLNIVTAGVILSERKGRDFIPHQSLALAFDFPKDDFYQVELAYDEAIRYLCREAITLPPGTPRGFVLLKYKGLSLGFCKNIGNRANNLYPNEWRIRHSK